MDNINININGKKNKKEIEILYVFFKRSLDILGSIIGLVLLSPIFFIVSALIKIESNGPIFLCKKE